MHDDVISTMNPNRVELLLKGTLHVHYYVTLS